MNVTHRYRPRPTTHPSSDTQHHRRFIFQQQHPTTTFKRNQGESGKDNFYYIGWLGKTIWKTISPSTNPPSIIGKNVAHISFPHWAPVIMHATCHLITCNGVLNPSPPWETDDRQTKYPSSMARKWTADRQRQTGLLGIHNIGGDNIGLVVPFI